MQSIMGNGPIQPVIQPVTIDTMLNSNGLDISDGLNFVTCEQTFVAGLFYLTVDAENQAEDQEWGKMFQLSQHLFSTH